MVIKYLDKFESIFYAVLYSNLTGNFLMSKNEVNNLFKNEDYIDIDKMNWQQILKEHDEKFGPINWYENDVKELYLLKDKVDLVLRHWKPFKYNLVVSVLNQAVKFGIDYVLNKESSEAKHFNKLVLQIIQEVNNALGYINFIPIEYKKEKFLIGQYKEENQIGDLLLKRLQEKYFGYNLLIKTNSEIYLYYFDQIYQVSVNNYELNLTDKSFNKFWQDFYRKMIRPQYKKAKHALV